MKIPILFSLFFLSGCAVVHEIEHIESGRFRFYPYCNTSIQLVNPDYELDPNTTLLEEIEACKDHLIFELTYKF